MIFQHEALIAQSLHATKIRTAQYSLVVVFSFLVLAVLVLTLACRKTRAPESVPPELTIAAASDLTAAFEEVGREFQADGKIKVTFAFGSTGLLTRQIENGAPFDLFAAANESYIDQLEQKGLIVPGTKTTYARGRITLWTREDSSLRIEKIEDLARPDVHRIAIANPDHAPYGQAAREALESAGIWETVRPKLVYGDNIRQTLQFAETGNVEVAIVAVSLNAQNKGRCVLVPETLHKPLNQALGIIKGTKDEDGARAFSAFVVSDKGREIMKKYGFAFTAHTTETPVMTNLCR